MARNEYILIVTVYYILNKAMGAVPGTFFWRPHVSVDLGSPTTEAPMLKEFSPSKESILAGETILIVPFNVGITMLAIASGLARAPTNEDLNPLKADIYINIYQWTLRFLSLIPNWSAGTDGHFCRTLQTWRRRFQNMDTPVPDWLRALTPISKKVWDDEDLERQRFKAFAESAFIKHYRFPKKFFTDYDSFISLQTSAFSPLSTSVAKP